MSWPKSSDEGAAIWTKDAEFRRKGDGGYTGDVHSSSGDYMGAVRYVVSGIGEPKNIYVGQPVAAWWAVWKPLGKISAVARRIAQGDFKVRIRKSHDDEIGDLCDTINDMAQELGASEKMKNDFISSVSHELRTPLTAIKGWAETMKMTGPADAVTMEKGMSIIVRETERLSGIVEELLDFSRMQNKAMVLMMDKIDLLAELDEAVYMYRERAISENKHLDFEEPESISPVLADKNRMHQRYGSKCWRAGAGRIRKMKNDFISSVSHELRTPLTATRMGGTMKMTGPADAVTMEKGMSIIVRETERLSRHCGGTLDFSRMQNKAMVLMMDKIDLLAELDEAVYMYRERAISENKHLDFEEPESISPFWRIKTECGRCLST